MSATDMVQVVGLSSDAVREGLKRPFDTGVVKVVGSVNPATIGLSLFAMVGVKVNGPIESVGAVLAQATSIDFVACVAGSFDLLVEVVASSTQLRAAG